MGTLIRWTSLLAVGSLTLIGCATEDSQSGGHAMSFFVTSANPGKGGDFGGLVGADQYCQKLASAAGAGNRTWRAYLSGQGHALNQPNVVHARDRIGTGPWYNAKGVLIAKNVDDLHSGNHINKETAIDERGNKVNGRTDKPNRHDILTGSRPDGTAFPGTQRFPDMTCGNWTKNTTEGSAMVGHHDRAGPTKDPWGVSWNSAHPTIGCTQGLIAKTGGDARIYCFAAN